MEGSDAVLAMLAWGYAEEARELFVPLLDFTRQGLENHQAGQKINDVVRYWWQTRDSRVGQGNAAADRARVQSICHAIAIRRRVLLPKERYCGDIATPGQLAVGRGQSVPGAARFAAGAARHRRSRIGRSRRQSRGRDAAENSRRRDEEHSPRNVAAVCADRAARQRSDSRSDHRHADRQLLELDYQLRHRQPHFSAGLGGGKVDSRLSGNARRLVHGHDSRGRRTEQFLDRSRSDESAVRHALRRSIRCAATIRSGHSSVSTACWPTASRAIR